MTFAVPAAEDTIEESRRAIAAYDRDRKERERRRLKLSCEVGDPSLGPGMWP